MRTAIIGHILLLTIIAFGAVSLVADYRASTAAPAAMRIDLPSLAYLNMSMTATVVLSDVTNLGGFEFTLAYDPAQVQLDDITLGDFLGSTGRTASGVLVRQGPGQVSYYAFTLAQTPAGPDGSGVLAQLALTPLVTGTVPLTLTAAQVVDVVGTPIDVAVSGGTLIVDTTPGDFDGDCDVDIIDVQSVAGRWGSRAGDGSFNARFDLDGDGDIDIGDVQRVAYRWGQRCAARP